ncbi:hypothetical protein A5761_05910 [Mycolicibacterium setense]|uniref:DUF7065 domain-containing protein n=1 Tax=Mycolicibacterium setense TaxID=431269 RepID=UPI0007E9AA48|nr:hypothetical protein [Mycolicibacterium setense]OBB20446.1 hypothetical protein A5761_05910 [Mycolicibacterium setense]
MTTGPYAATDDEFHPPTDPADPEWSETCWFTFTVPERRLSGQLYPFFKPTLGVMSAGAYFWDDTGDQIWNCLYAKNFWHLPMPSEPLSNLNVANGSCYAVLEPGSRYHIGYDDPDGGDEIHVDLTFTGTSRPHLLGESHLDQPGRFQGEIVLRGERIPVDAYGFRDRSWGPRSQHGVGIHATPSKRGGYSYATASEDAGFHAITMDFGDGTAQVIHGYLLRDGAWGKLISGRREVVDRDHVSGAPTSVVITAVDEHGRNVEASGKALNRLGFAINPNLWTWNCLTEWTWDGITAFGEDHDNWSAAGQREFSRQFFAGRRSSGLAVPQSRNSAP